MVTGMKLRVACSHFWHSWSISDEHVDVEHGNPDGFYKPGCEPRRCKILQREGQRLKISEALKFLEALQIISWRTDATLRGSSKS